MQVLLSREFSSALPMRWKSWMIIEALICVAASNAWNKWASFRFSFEAQVVCNELNRSRFCRDQSELVQLKQIEKSGTFSTRFWIFHRKDPGVPERRILQQQCITTICVYGTCALESELHSIWDSFKNHWWILGLLWVTCPSVSLRDVRDFVFGVTHFSSTCRVSRCASILRMWLSQFQRWSFLRITTPQRAVERYPQCFFPSSSIAF